LYNKRIDPKDPSGNPVQLEFKAMNKEPRPKLYFKHYDILDSTLLEPSTMSLYLHQNMPGFFGDIGDLADCLETYSH
jgi:hypothetical protein